jgi:S-adenosylmethionine:tRNA ribosyltransferase-isomerase
MSAAAVLTPSQPIRDDAPGTVYPVPRLASEPPEARGVTRDGVRLLVSHGLNPPVHATFDRVADFLEPGDLLVVNDSPTRNAAIDVVGVETTERPFVVHVSTELPGGGDLWTVEIRRRLDDGASEPFVHAEATTLMLPGLMLPGNSRLQLLRPVTGSQRLWVAALDGDVLMADLLALHGRPIRYRYVTHDWPLDTYQTVFASPDLTNAHHASAEMPSAARPFSDAVVTSLARRGVGIATVTLHTGVSSLEGHEDPYPEQFAVPEHTATLINATHAAGHRVVAVGTTVVRAVETAVDSRGAVHPAHGWTDTVITPQRGVRAVDGVITGWHEPGASHLWMLEAIAGDVALRLAYDQAIRHSYLWHEFGDSHLILSR